MEKELNVSLFELKDEKIYGIIDKKIDGHLFDPSDYIEGENYVFVPYYEITTGLFRNDKEYFINLYRGICINKIEDICSKQNLDIDNIEKISIYTKSDTVMTHYLNYIVDSCNKLGIKDIDWYQAAPDDPKGYYMYKIDTENYKSKTEIYLELIKACSENKEIDGVIYNEETDTGDYDKLFNIILNRCKFLYNIIFDLSFIPNCPDYTIYLYIPENIYNHITEFGISLSILTSLAIDGTGNKLFIVCKDKISKTEFDDELFSY